MQIIIFLTSAIIFAVSLLPIVNAQKKKSTRRFAAVAAVGVGGRAATKRKKSGAKVVDGDEDVHRLLARSIQQRLNASSPTSSSDSIGSSYDIDTISKALRSIASTQATLKKIDGTAHEMYQRTHKSSTSLGDEEEEEEEEEDDESDGEEEDEDNEGSSSSSSGNKTKKKKTKLGGLKVAGRMSRNAARVGCIADAFFAAELCELLEDNHLSDLSLDVNDDDEGTLASWTGRKVLLNTTIYSDGDDEATSDQQNHHRLAISILVIYEQDYNGGAGREHGGVDDLLSVTKEELEDDDDGSGERTAQSIPQQNATNTKKPRGRYLIVLSDHFENTQSGHRASSSRSRGSNDLPLIISTLDKPPQRLRMHPKRSEEMDSSSSSSASVCGPLYHMARKVLETVQPVLDMENPVTIATESSEESNADEGNGDENEQGTRASTGDDSESKKAAIHFVGYSLAGGVAAISACIMEGTLPCLQHQQFTGSGSARTSALCLGPPPCLSSNLQSDFVTSIIHGDDVVCRTTHGTINHLCDRARRTIKGGILGRSVGWMGEAVSLTVSGLKGNSNNEKKGVSLVVPGSVYLVRPRRIGGGSSSIHEIGGRGSRESLRAALLWQLNDVLVSKSLWAHHRLDAYIQSLDKVRLKGFGDDPSSD
ncbi:hypothetical protein ACHAWU_006418 [Discostella pseudostelligera]|uniref:Fungal lipase-like domain-containing protein n=1 Tax=Discostella pseudostelligera TaxID=259834 RepID=A0ABD3M432_9STRA